MEDNTFKSCPVKIFIIAVSVKENDTFSSDDTFPASFPNIFVNYPLGKLK